MVFPLPRLGQILGGLPSQPELRVGPARFLEILDPAEMSTALYIS